MIRKPRTRGPIVPADPNDRTGSAGIRRRAVAAIRRRYDGLLREVLGIFAGIRILAPNDATTTLARTVYQLTPDELAAVAQQLREAADRWLASGRETAHLFWWSPFDAEAAQAGATQSWTNLSGLSPTYAGATTLQDVLFGDAYRTRVGIAQVKSYEHWTGLAAESRATLSQIIGRAVVDGKNPRDVRREIQEALDVSKSRALQYAQTDITDTLREARMAESDRAAEDLGIATGLLWTSALKPTTRPWHASRHGKVFSAPEVKEFYGQRGNRYNCFCSITECLLDESGAPILTDTLKTAMRKERATWDKAHGGAS